MLFNRETERVGSIETRLDIKTVPMLYRASIDFVRNHNCKLLTEFTRVCRADIGTKHFRHCSIDSRVSMLMPGWFPAIPGWHCDDFFRPDGEPALSRVEFDAPQVHYMICLGECSLTEFLKGPVDLPNEVSLPRVEGETVYGAYHRMIGEKKPQTWKVSPGVVYRFGPTDFHQCTAATESGWRLFARATFSNHREPRDEVRQQTQVYLPTLYAGW